jgi:hypothetical protein
LSKAKMQMQIVERLRGRKRDAKGRQRAADNRFVYLFTPAVGKFEPLFAVGYSVSITVSRLW